MKDVVVIGGGVVGLSIAYELALAGLSVAIVDKGDLGREASWAGAGMLPPGDPSPFCDEWDQLFKTSNEMWPSFSESLKELTGIDNGFRKCGGIQIHLDSNSEDVKKEIARWEDQGTTVNRLDEKSIQNLEPKISKDIPFAYELPETCQVRNPWHVRALISACIQSGVESYTEEEIVKIDYDGETIKAIHSKDETLTAKQFIFAAGAWTTKLLKERGFEQSITPLLGQIILLSTPKPIIQRILEDGKRYIVPREDGKVLIGSTEEQTNFEKRNTVQGVMDLLEFAKRVVPDLESANFESNWSGLRPKPDRNLPFIGRLPNSENGFIASGHYRAGLQLSPITAVLMRQLILGEKTDINLEPFGCEN